MRELKSISSRHNNKNQHHTTQSHDTTIPFHDQQYLINHKRLKRHAQSQAASALDVTAENASHISIHSPPVALIYLKHSRKIFLKQRTMRLNSRTDEDSYPKNAYVAPIVTEFRSHELVSDASWPSSHKPLRGSSSRAGTFLFRKLLICERGLKELLLSMCVRTSFLAALFF